MSTILVILAGLICLLYTGYFVKIIKGDPQGFERAMIKSLADWIITKGTVSKVYIWAMLFWSMVIVFLYFGLTLRLINNPFMRYLTSIFIAIESFHLSRIAITLGRFFAGKALLGQIFNWRVERASALLFFTHSVLVLAMLIFF